MAVNDATLLALYVRTATGPDVWTAVNDINRFGKRTNRPTSTHPVFMRATAYTTYGVREETYTLAGFLNAADAGQNYLRAQEQARANVTIRVEPVAGSGQGFEQLVSVGSTNFDADAGGGLEEYGFEFGAQAPATSFGSPGIVF